MNTCKFLYLKLLLKIVKLYMDKNLNATSRQILPRCDVCYCDHWLRCHVYYHKVDSRGKSLENFHTKVVAAASSFLAQSLAVKVKMHKEMSIHKHLLYDWASATKSWCLLQWSKANPNSMELVWAAKTHYHQHTTALCTIQKYTQCNQKCEKPARMFEK